MSGPAMDFAAVLRRGRVRKWYLPQRVHGSAAAHRTAVRESRSATLLVAGSVALVVSLGWLVASSRILGSDDDWRWAQPRTGVGPMPTAPSLVDLYAPRQFRTSEFTVDLPAGEYGVALAVDPPYGDGHLVISNASGTPLETWWVGGTGWLSAGGIGEFGFGGGPTEFQFEGEGLFLLGSVGPARDLAATGTASFRVGGRLASGVPDDAVDRVRGPGLAPALAWSADAPVRVTVYDSNFHAVGRSEGVSGTVELRTGSSLSALFVVEGSAAVRAWLTAVAPWVPALVAVLGSAAGIVAVDLWRRRERSSRGGPAS